MNGTSLSTRGFVAVLVCVLGAAGARGQVPTLSLNSDSNCYDPGDIVTVTVDMSFSEIPICAGQFFLEYDPVTLDFLDVEPGGVPPFEFEVFQGEDEEAGTIDYAVGSLVGGCANATQGPITMAVITFQAVDTCTPFVRFRDNNPPTRLVDQKFMPVKPKLVDMNAIKIFEDVAPGVNCPDDIIVFADPDTFTGVAIWDEVTATDSCGQALEVSCDATSGEAYPIGVTEVTCQAADLCDVPGACMFVIEVLEPDVDAPFIVHGIGAIGETRPFTGYVDSRLESTDGQALDLGLGEVVLVFSEPVRALDGGPLTADSFVVTTTGGAVPVIDAVDDSENPTVRLSFKFGTNPAPALNEWTTIRAVVSDICCNEIVSEGDLGPGEEEPDRVDFLFLPGDVDQSHTVEPLDILVFRQMLLGVLTPELGILEDYVDTDRNGEIAPLDFLRFRQLILGVPPATQAWVGQVANHEQP